MSLRPNGPHRCFPPPHRAFCASLLCIVAFPLAAQTPADATHQALDDAWWTGPVIANGASTMPRGHFLVEPYLYDVISDDAHNYGSLTYLLYGVHDRLTVGLVPEFGYIDNDTGADSSHVGVGDTGVLVQYRLRQFREGSWLPTVSLQLQETLPTGRHDRLDNAADGFGSGAYATLLQVNTQTYFWMPNGRLLRMRANAGTTHSRTADVRGVSVYGTPAGFSGQARPGDTVNLNLAWEYSVTRNWVLALDAMCQRRASTRVEGYDLSDPAAPAPLNFESPRSVAYAFAPAVEYNFSASLGLLFGVRLMAGNHVTNTLTPVVAINYVH